MSPPHSKGRTSALIAFAMLAGEGAALSYFCQLMSLGGGELDDFVGHNKLGPHARNLMLASGAAGAAAMIAGVGSIALLYRKRGGLSLLSPLAFALAPLAALYALPVLLNARLWHKQPLPFLLLSSLFVFAVRKLAALSLENLPQVAAVWRALRSGAPSRVATDSRPGLARRIGQRLVSPSPSAVKWSCGAVVVLCASAYTVYTAHYTLMTHRRMATSAFDLGIYDNLLYNALHGRLFRSPVCMGHGDGNYLSNHAEFAMLLYLPIYALRPGAVSLILLQAVVLGFAALPLYAFASQLVVRPIAAVVAVCYLLYAPLHGPQFYDFHWLPLAVFFFFLLFYALAAERLVLSIVSVAVLFLIREDISAGLCVFGVFLAVTRTRVRFGVWLAGVALVWFVVVKFVLMPWAGPWWFSNIYGELISEGEKGYESVVKTILVNPAFFLTTLFKEQKLIYLLHILVPLAFLPCRRPVFLLLAIPGFFFTLMTTGYDPTLSISFQYTAHWIGYMFGATVLALAWLGKGPRGPLRQQSSTVALAAGVLVHSYVFGCVLQRRTFVGGFSHIGFEISQWEKDRLAVLEELVATIPQEASVLATETEVPHLSARKFAYTMRNESVDADYLVMFRERVGDSEREHVKEAISKSPYQLVGGKMGVYLFRKGPWTVETWRAFSELGVSLNPPPT